MKLNSKPGRCHWSFTICSFRSTGRLRAGFRCRTLCGRKRTGPLARAGRWRTLWHLVFQRVRSLTLKIYSRLWCREGFVNKTDDDSDDSPLDEVSRSLHQSEFQPDVQVHVVVQDKCANHENANENAEARTFRSARSALMVHCENYGDNQDRYESSAESDWHNLHHFFLRPEYGRVLVAFFDKTWQQPKHQE